jgi:SAM-dependent methyltransferase
VWWSELERYERAFRTGDGISWSAQPGAHADGMDMITRAVVAPALVGGWVPALDGFEARLSAGAAVADVGCGYGAAVIAMAEAFPASTFTGYDVDDASVARGRKAALGAGVADRVSFEVASAADIAGGPFDLVVFIDALHDLGDPVGALRQCRQVLADDGAVLLVEHAGSDRLEENLHPVGRFFYAASALVCVPNALAEAGDGTPLGSIPGEQALRRAAQKGGFSSVRRIDADAPLNLLLELRP